MPNVCEDPECTSVVGCVESDWMFGEPDDAANWTDVYDVPVLGGVDVYVVRMEVCWCGSDACSTEDVSDADVLDVVVREVEH